VERGRTICKKFPALGGHDDAVIARERCRHHANPEDDEGRKFSRLPDADDVSASPLHLHRVQKDMELESQVALPDYAVADGAKLLDLPVRLRASGRLTRSGAGESGQERGRGQAGVVELDLHLRRRGPERKGRTLRRADISHGRLRTGVVISG
jgi:hypothetical protein